MHRTKIVATMGPASNSPDITRQMLRADERGAAQLLPRQLPRPRRINRLRLAADVDLPLLQDLQGFKIRVGELPATGIMLNAGGPLALAPIADLLNV